MKMVVSIRTEDTQTESFRDDSGNDSSLYQTNNLDIEM